MMHTWIHAYRRGRRSLSKHDAEAAVRAFQEALNSCPVTSRSSAARILYSLGLALQQSGHPSLAAKSWVNARKLSRRGWEAKSCERWVNGYGMRRCASAGEDDFNAFRAIQVARYLSKRGSGRFGSRAERDVVYELIRDAWKVIQRSGILAAMSVSERLSAYRRARVDLPFLYVEDALERDCEPIRGNFRPGAPGSLRVAPDDRCPCGSGLPRRMCCGRLYSCAELESGSL